MIILGHRGYSAKYPENTLIAFKKAIEHGADGVELDVWLTRDGCVVIHHDEYLGKTVGIDRSIKTLTCDEIDKLEFRGEKIPTLEDVYRALPDTAIINVEIKDAAAVQRSLAIVEKYNALQRTIFSSFNYAALKKLREISPNARIGILLDSCKSGILFPYRAKKIGAEFVNPPILARKKLGLLFHFFLHFYRFLGYKVAFWTVNNPADMKGIEHLAEIIITDEVETMVEHFGKV